MPYDRQKAEAASRAVSSGLEVSGKMIEGRGAGVLLPPGGKWRENTGLTMRPYVFFQSTETFERQLLETPDSFRGLNTKQNALLEGPAVGVRRAVLSGGPKNSAPSDRKPGQVRNVSHAALPQ